MKRMLFFVLSSALAAPAFAQTSTCQWIGNVWTCNTPRQSPGIDWGLQNRQPEQPSVMDSFRHGYEDGQLRRRQEQQNLADEQARLVTQNAAQMVAAGKCRDAGQYAAANGQFKLATDIANYCAANGQ
jgi:hypothetical protein